MGSRRTSCYGIENMTSEQAHELVNDLYKEYYVRAKERDLDNILSPGQLIHNLIMGDGRDIEKLNIGMWWFGTKYENVQGNEEMVLEILQKGMNIQQKPYS